MGYLKVAKGINPKSSHHKEKQLGVRIGGDGC